MKKLIYVGFLILGLILTSNTASYAQEGNLQIGGGLVYGSEIENLGIKADGYYTIDDQFRVGADLTYFFPESAGNLDVNWFGINFNGNYLFYSEEALDIYGLAGLNILIIDVSDGNSSRSDSELGLNLGGGLEYALDFANLFGELKLAGLGGDADQLVLGAGLRFDI